MYEESTMTAEQYLLLCAEARCLGLDPVALISVGGETCED